MDTRAQTQALSQRWVVIVMPRGDVIPLDEEFDGYSFDALTVTHLTGSMDPNARDPLKVVVRGHFVSLAWREQRPRL